MSLLLLLLPLLSAATVVAIDGSVFMLLLLPLFLTVEKFWFV